MADGKKMDFSSFVPTALAVFVAMAVFSLVDRFVLTKIGNHLENLLEGEDE